LGVAHTGIKEITFDESRALFGRQNKNFLFCIRIIKRKHHSLNAVVLHKKICMHEADQAKVRFTSTTEE
jgi:hypothetical protein